MSDDYLRRALSDAEASAQRVVTAPGVEAVRRSLRRRRRDRVVLAVLLVAAVVSGSIAVLAARAEPPVPPINRNTPSVRPNITLSEQTPGAQVAAPPVTTSSPPAPKTPCTSSLIAVHEGGTRVRALDISGRAMPICSGATLRVRLDTYQIDPGTTVARIDWGAQGTLESSQPATTFPLQTPPGCSWWVITASNTMLPPASLDLANYRPGTPQSPFWDQAAGRDGQIFSSSWAPCPGQSRTPGP